MTQKKELPGATLPDRPGMHFYGGYIEGEFRYRIYVPTTIRDPQAAVLMAYKLHERSQQYPDSPETVVARRAVPLHSMPRWDEEYQTIMLSTRDQRIVVQELEKLERNASRLEKKLREA
ncbi:MAG: hypothetical protein Q7S55_01970 [Nanoarchaeota archaeon]|nr:hypothetical protein [Nanoarchaeota archaeon]